jgi:hypothetical protein
MWNRSLILALFLVIGIEINPLQVSAQTPLAVYQQFQMDYGTRNFTALQTLHDDSAAASLYERYLFSKKVDSRQRTQLEKEEFDRKTKACAVNGALRQAIYLYTGWAYQDLNRELRTSSLSESSLVLALVLDTALKKLPRFGGTVYRAARSQYEPQLLQMRVGEVISMPGFSSSSTNNNYFFGKGYDLHLIIRSKKGVNIRACSYVPEEDEILFRPNSKFRLLKSETLNGFPTLYLEEIP